MAPASPSAAFPTPLTGEVSVLQGTPGSEIPGHFCCPCPDLEVAVAAGDGAGSATFVTPEQDWQKRREMCWEAAGIASGSRRWGRDQR